MNRLLWVACVVAACTPGWPYGVKGSPAAAGAAVGAESPASTRPIRFNGRALNESDTRVLAELERVGGGRLPDGDYWYDRRCGAWGIWGGPGVRFTVPGLDLGGPLPSNASGGGRGTLTGVFVNGRELHPVDVQRLVTMYGSVVPGRYWVDASLNFGYDGGPPIGNLAVLARQGGSAGGRAGGDTTYTPGLGGSTGPGIQTGPPRLCHRRELRRDRLLNARHSAMPWVRRHRRWMPRIQDG